MSYKLEVPHRNEPLESGYSEKMVDWPRWLKRITQIDRISTAWSRLCSQTFEKHAAGAVSATDPISIAVLQCRKPIVSGL
jgi:hypothetical protein